MAFFIPFIVGTVGTWAAGKAYDYFMGSSDSGVKPTSSISQGYSSLPSSFSSYSSSSSSFSSASERGTSRIYGPSNSSFSPVMSRPRRTNFSSRTANEPIQAIQRVTLDSRYANTGRTARERVSRHGSRIVSVAAVSKEVDNNFKVIAQQLQVLGEFALSVDKRFANVEKVINKKFEQYNESLHKSQRALLTGLDRRLADVDRRIDGVESRLFVHQNKLQRLRTDLGGLQYTVAKLEKMVLSSSSQQQGGSPLSFNSGSISFGSSSFSKSTAATIATSAVTSAITSLITTAVANYMMSSGKDSKDASFIDDKDIYHKTRKDISMKARKIVLDADEIVLRGKITMGETTPWPVEKSSAASQYKGGRNYMGPAQSGKGSLPPHMRGGPRDSMGAPTLQGGQYVNPYGEGGAYKGGRNYFAPYNAGRSSGGYSGGSSGGYSGGYSRGSSGGYSGDSGGSGSSGSSSYSGAGRSSLGGPPSSSLGGGPGGTGAKLVGGATVPKHMDKSVYDALNSVAAKQGLDPAAIAMMIDTESKWDKGNVTKIRKRYAGLTQIGQETMDEARWGITQDQFRKMSHAQQIEYYGKWLDHYKFREKLGATDLDISKMSAPEQAAVLQSMQFAPNNTVWMKNIAKGIYDTPATDKKQARVLGSTSFADMRSYYERRYNESTPTYLNNENRQPQPNERRQSTNNFEFVVNEKTHKFLTSRYPEKAPDPLYGVVHQTGHGTIKAQLDWMSGKNNSKKSGYSAIFDDTQWINTTAPGYRTGHVSANDIAGNKVNEVSRGLAIVGKFSEEKHKKIILDNLPKWLVAHNLTVDQLKSHSDIIRERGLNNSEDREGDAERLTYDRGRGEAADLIDFIHRNKKDIEDRRISLIKNAPSPNPDVVISETVKGNISPQSKVVENALSVKGLHERKDRDTLIQFLKDGGRSFVDPSTAAWCASFVNASLAKAGIKGTDSAAAGSFHSWGTQITSPEEVKAGDVLVNYKRSPRTGMIGSHVTLASGPAFQDESGRWKIPSIGGNEKNRVSEDVRDWNQWAVKRATEDYYLGDKEGLSAFNRTPINERSLINYAGMSKNNGKTMTTDRVIEAQQQERATRSQPIQQELKRRLQYAATRASELTNRDLKIRVHSGGQPSSGPNRVGSHEHDHGGAADFKVVVTENGKERYLNLHDENDRKVWEIITEEAARSGIRSAGSEYMGAETVHFGISSKNARAYKGDKWFKNAWKRGWDSRKDFNLDQWEATHRSEVSAAPAQPQQTPFVRPSGPERKPNAPKPGSAAYWANQPVAQGQTGVDPRAQRRRPQSEVEKASAPAQDARYIQKVSPQGGIVTEKVATHRPNVAANGAISGGERLVAQTPKKTVREPQQAGEKGGIVGGRKGKPVKRRAKAGAGAGAGSSGSRSGGSSRGGGSDVRSPRNNVGDSVPPSPGSDGSGEYKNCLI